MSDKRISLLVKKQLPEFISEDNPRFVSFLEAYYEFLDNTSYGKAKDIRDISDIDVHMDEFEQQFFNSFIPFLPRDTKINKEFIIKNIMPLYLSKGSEKSFKYLFRLLFDQEIEVDYPGKYVLKASDGRWIQENILRTTTNVYSEYIGDGVESVYYLPQLYDISQIVVTVNDIETSDYTLYRESKKIVFNTIPEPTSNIKIFFTYFDINLFENKKIVGLTSHAEALIEKAGTKRSYGSNFFEFLINYKTLVGRFINGESLNIIITSDNKIIPLVLQTYSDIDSITIIDGGTNYDVGDAVIIKGTPIKEAKAIVDRVTSGAIEDLQLLDGGAGFKVGANVIAVGYSKDYFDASVLSVDPSGIYSCNNITYNTDVISDYANTTLDSVDFGFNPLLTENIDSTLISTLNNLILPNLGAITLINVSKSLISSTLSPIIDVEPEYLAPNVTVRDLGGIGKIKIENGGLNYQNNDVLIFTNELAWNERGAEAYVRSVTANGSIATITINNCGIGYSFEKLPDISVASNTGSGAILSVSKLMGDGEILKPIASGIPYGEILSIKLLDRGIGYTIDPGIDLRFSGDGTAKATAQIRNTYINLEGRWKTSDGLLSTEEIVLQGKDYYIDFAYVITAQVEFSKYKSVLKTLLHPAGLINYAKYKVEHPIDINTKTEVTSTQNLTVPGTVNISNNSSIVTGSNTYFNIANQQGIITIGTGIVINNQIRYVSSIQSNNILVVNTNFTSTSNNEFIKII